MARSAARAGVGTSGLVGAALLLGACGGDDPEPAATTSTTAAPTTTTTTTEPDQVHVVESGETLGAIAQRYGTTVQAIAEANELADPNVLAVGQELVIPNAATSDTTDTTAAPGDTTDTTAPADG